MLTVTSRGLESDPMNAMTLQDTSRRRTSSAAVVSRPVTLAVLHPKGGVGRSTTVWHLGAELALQRLTVRIEDLDQAKHLTNIVQRRGLLVPGLSIGEDGPADIVLLDTAPEADTARGIGYLRRADLALVPVKGPEEASVQAIGLVLEWLESAPNCRLLGFLPTMATPRWAESRLWMDELDRLARNNGATVFASIPMRASLAAWRLDGHPYAPLAKELRAVRP
jgi:cellulose biosynthesis protein BcsQ